LNSRFSAEKSSLRSIELGEIKEDEHLIKLVTPNLKPRDKKRITDHLLGCGLSTQKLTLKLI